MGLEILGTSEHCVQHGTTRRQVSDTQHKHFVSSKSTKSTKGRGHWGGGSDIQREDRKIQSQRESLSVCLSI